jgi:hypothetical protein
MFAGPAARFSLFFFEINKYSYLNLKMDLKKAKVSRTEKQEYAQRMRQRFERPGIYDPVSPGLVVQKKSTISGI